MSGLEVIGSVASVLQLAATVYSISRTLYEVGGALSNAPSEIKDLARDLETFSEELNLLSSLLSDKTHHYSDRVYRLTAKIIGDCASICIKIDRILRKLRSGSFLSRVKWVFKEKEIMKLLVRLRDLKLSLMGTLSLLNALKADHLMNAMGVGKPSLLERSSDEKLSKKTEEQVEETRKALASISTTQETVASLSRTTSATTLAPSIFQTTTENQGSLNLGEEKEVLPQTQSTIAFESYSTFKSRGTGIQEPKHFEFISAMALPTMDVFRQLPQAMESVESFHSAHSRHESFESLGNKAPVDENLNGSLSTPNPAIEKWRSEMAEVAMKNFNMDRVAAGSWAAKLPLPDSSNTEKRKESLKEREETKIRFENDSSSLLQRSNARTNCFDNITCSTIEPAAKEEKFDAFHEIKLDDTRLMLDTKSTTGFGLWGSSWATGTSTWDFSVTATSTNTKKEAKIESNPWSLNSSKSKNGTGFTFNSLDEVDEKPIEPDPLEEKKDGNTFNFGFSSISKKGKKKKKGVFTFETEEEAENKEELLLPLVVEELAEDWISSWGTTSKKKGKKSEAAVVEEPPLPAPVEELAEDLTSSWGTTSKKKGKCIAAIVEEPLLPSPVEEPAEDWFGFGGTPSKKKGKKAKSVEKPPPPPPVEESAEDWPGFRGTAPKEKRKKSTAAMVEEPPPPLPVEEPAEDWVSSWGTTSKKKGKKGKKEKKVRAAIAGEPLLPPPVGEPAEDWIASSWGTTSKEGKKGKATIVEEPKAEDPIVPELESEAKTKDDNLSGWGSFSTKKNKKKKKCVVVEEATPAKVEEPPALEPEPELETEEDLRWGSFSTSKKDKKKKKGAIVEEPKVEEAVTFPEPEPESEPNDDSFSWGFSTSKKGNKKNKKAAIKQSKVEEPILAPAKPEPKPNTKQDDGLGDIWALMVETRELERDELESPAGELKEYGFRDNHNSALPITLAGTDRIQPRPLSSKGGISRSSTKQFRLEFAAIDELGEVVRENSELWFKAIAQLLTLEGQEFEGLSMAWAKAYNHLLNPFDATADSVASLVAGNLARIIDEVRTELLEFFTDSAKLAVASIDRFYDVMKVIKETLNFKPGAFVWICLWRAEYEIIENRLVDKILKDRKSLADIAEVATLVARYNVLESMYQHWDGMSLHQDYEELLIDLCVKVLKYLNSALTGSSDKEKEDLMLSIREADTGCRKFSVTISEAENIEELNARVQDAESDDFDSSSEYEDYVDGVEVLARE